MVYHQPPPSEQEIARQPLEFIRLESASDQFVFTDRLLTIWTKLAGSGSLATLPPVPDVLEFAGSCLAFFLVFHNNVTELAPTTGSESRSSQSPSQGDRRYHPYSRSSTRNSKQSIDEEYGYDEDQPFGSRFSIGYNRGVIGCVYLALSPATQKAVDIGIALQPNARGKGYGRAVLTYAMRFAFDTLEMHRVVANVFGPSDGQFARASARESATVRWIFEKIGFTYEGTHRRAAFSTTDGTWRDVQVLAMLDTDWVMLQGRGNGRASIATPWDLMVERHEKELTEISDWMEDPAWSRLRRTGSTETLRGGESPDYKPQESSMDEVEPVASGSGHTDPFRTTDNRHSDSWFSEDSVSIHDESPVSSPAAQSSIDVSPPASVISLLSDYDWRSIENQSQPSVGSSPSIVSGSSWHELSVPPSPSPSATDNN